MIAIRICRRCGRTFDAIVEENNSVYCAACTELAELEKEFSKELEDEICATSDYVHGSVAKNTEAKNAACIEELVLKNIKQGNILGSHSAASTSRSSNHSAGKKKGQNSGLSEEDELVKFFSLL